MPQQNPYELGSAIKAVPYFQRTLNLQADEAPYSVVRKVQEARKSDPKIDAILRGIEAELGPIGDVGEAPTAWKTLPKTFINDLAFGLPAASGLMHVTEEESRSTPGMIGSAAGTLLPFAAAALGAIPSAGATVPAAALAGGNLARSVRGLAALRPAVKWAQAKTFLQAPGNARKVAGGLAAVGGLQGAGRNIGAQQRLQEEQPWKYKGFNPTSLAMETTGNALLSPLGGLAGKPGILPMTSLLRNVGLKEGLKDTTRGVLGRAGLGAIAGAGKQGAAWGLMRGGEEIAGRPDASASAAFGTGLGSTEALIGALLGGAVGGWRGWKAPQVWQKAMAAEEARRAPFGKYSATTPSLAWGAGFQPPEPVPAGAGQAATTPGAAAGAAGAPKPKAKGAKTPQWAAKPYQPLPEDTAKAIARNLNTEEALRLLREQETKRPFQDLVVIKDKLYYDVGTGISGKRRLVPYDDPNGKPLDWPKGALRSNIQGWVIPNTVTGHPNPEMIPASQFDISNGLYRELIGEGGNVRTIRLVARSKGDETLEKGAMYIQDRDTGGLELLKPDDPIAVKLREAEAAARKLKVQKEQLEEASRGATGTPWGGGETPKDVDQQVAEFVKAATGDARNALILYKMLTQGQDNPEVAKLIQEGLAGRAAKTAPAKKIAPAKQATPRTKRTKAKVQQQAAPNAEGRQQGVSSETLDDLLGKLGYK